MHTHFKPQARICALIAAASVSVLALTACERAPSDVPTPTTEGTERRDDTREPAMTPPTPVTPGNPATPADPSTTPGAPPATSGTQ